MPATFVVEFPAVDGDGDPDETMRLERLLLATSRAVQVVLVRSDNPHTCIYAGATMRCLACEMKSQYEPEET